MRFSSAVVATGLLSLAAAHPVEVQASLEGCAGESPDPLPTIISANDEAVAQLALYLEHLERALYTGGFENFTEAEYQAEGFPPGFRDNVGLIAKHENTHSTTIEAILTKSGKSPVPVCEYKFPYNSPTTFVDLANMITSVGIGAYLGGGALIMDNDQLLTAATSILTVESRHDAYLRAGVKGSPFPSPFDTALTSVFAYNLAQMFIVSCPRPLPIIILPKLTLEAPAPSPNLVPIATGTTLRFSYDPTKFFVAVDPNAPLYIGLINSVTNVTYTEISKCGTGCAEIPVPEGAKNAAFAVLTTFGPDAKLTEDQLTQFGALAGPAEIIIS